VILSTVIVQSGTRCRRGEYSPTHAVYDSASHRTVRRAQGTAGSSFANFGRTGGSVHAGSAEVEWSAADREQLVVQ